MSPHVCQACVSSSRDAEVRQPARSRGAGPCLDSNLWRRYCFGLFRSNFKRKRLLRVIGALSMSRTCFEFERNLVGTSQLDGRRALVIDPCWPKASSNFNLTPTWHRRATQKQTSWLVAQPQIKRHGLRSEFRRLNRVPYQFKEAQQEHESGSVRYLARCRPFALHNFSATVHFQKQVAGSFSADERLQEG